MVFFGGTQPTGGGQLRKQMGQLGLLAIPYVGPDGITDLESADQTGSFISLAGIDNAGNTFGSVAGLKDPTDLGPVPDVATFNAAYKAAYGQDPGAYSALAYACAQLLINSLETAVAAGTSTSDIAAIREAVRAGVFTAGAVPTVLGPLTVDANGDTGTWLSLYKTDTTLNSGKGGWTFIRQQNFAPGAEAPAGSPAASPAQ